MPGVGGTSDRSLRKSFAACLLAAAVVGGGACVGVTIEPTDPEWVVTGPDGAPQAVWTFEDVEIVVPLRYPGDATHVAAEVRNHGRETARLTFLAPGGSTALLPLGTVDRGPTTTEQAVSENVVPGRAVEVPAGVLGSPGTVRLSLLPDDRWGADDAPEIGSKVTLDLDVETGAVYVPCGFRFRVVGSPEGGWSSLDRTGRVLVLLLISAVTAGVVIWAD